MSKYPFDIILWELCLTGHLPPHYNDKLLQSRDLISAWNLHMQRFFNSSWVICLDESMSICIISGHVQDGFSVHTSFIHLSMKITLLAVVGLVSCFLLNFLNEQIIIESSVQWNSHNLARQMDYFCICSISYFWTGNYVVLDSGFCVHEALI